MLHALLGPGGLAMLAMLRLLSLSDQFGHLTSVATGSRLEHKSSLPGELWVQSPQTVTMWDGLLQEDQRHPGLWPQRRVCTQGSLCAHRVSPQ